MLASLFQTEPETIQTPDVAWRGLAPLLVLLGGSLIILLLSALMRRKPFPGLWTVLTVVTAGAAIGTCWPLWNETTSDNQGPFFTLARAVYIDGFAVFLTVIICASVILAALLADGYLRRERLEGAELYVLVLLSASGGIVMATAADLIVMFLGLEILSIAVYVLAAMHLRRIESQEAGMKYFVLGAFASAFFLYGIALVYGSRGSTNLVDISNRAPFDQATGEALRSPALLLAGMALLLVGFGFKISAVPFHSWAPDVYQGSPSPVVAFMASGVKVAGFAGMLRVFWYGFGANFEEWQPFIYGLAVATLLVGSVLAIVQTDVKRMLAYSSIAHAGFVLVGVQAFTVSGQEGAMFYLAAYTFMVAGSFGIVTVLSRRGDSHTSLDDFKGLARREPVLAFVFAVLLFAQAGVPLTSGFFAKFFVLRAAIEENSWPLAITAMVSAVIAAFLYLRITVSMYMSDDEDADEADAAEPRPVEPRVRVPFAAGLALAVCFIVTLVAGFFPDTIANPSRDAIEVQVQPATAEP